MRIIVLAILCFLFAACAPEKPGTAAVRKRVLSGREAEAVIEVGDEEITVDEVQQRFERLRTVLPSTKAGAAELAPIVDFELLADEAERRGYGNDPRVVNAVKDDLAAELDRRGEKPADVPVDADEAAVKAAFEAAEKKKDG